MHTLLAEKIMGTLSSLMFEVWMAQVDRTRFDWAILLNKNFKINLYFRQQNNISIESSTWYSNRPFESPFGQFLTTNSNLSYLSNEMNDAFVHEPEQSLYKTSYRNIFNHNSNTGFDHTNFEHSVYCSM